MNNDFNFKFGRIYSIYDNINYFKNVNIWINYFDININKLNLFNVYLLKNLQTILLNKNKFY